MRSNTLAKAEWGTKRRCLNCSAKFYDLGRNPIVCPKCETVFTPETPKTSGGGRAVAAPKPKPVEKIVPVEVAVEDGEVALDEAAEEGEAELIEDAAELGEDDVEGVIEKPADGKEEV